MDPKTIFDFLAAAGQMSPTGILVVAIYMAIEFNNFKKSANARLLNIEERQNIMVEYIVKGNPQTATEMLSRLLNKEPVIETR